LAAGFFGAVFLGVDFPAFLVVIGPLLGRWNRESAADAVTARNLMQQKSVSYKNNPLHINTKMNPYTRRLRAS
jgi:hypothetical protein